MGRVEWHVDEHQLHVRALKGFVAAPQHRRLGEVGPAGGNRLCRFVNNTAERVVVQIAPYAGQVVHHLDICGFELWAGPTPDRSNNRGESTAPALTTTSASA